MQQTWRDRPPYADVAVAGAVVLLVLADLLAGLDTPGATHLSIAMGFLAAVSLAWRRRWPLQVLIVVAIAGLVPTTVTGSYPSFYASFVPALVAGYALAAYSSRRRALLYPLISVVLFVAFAARSAAFRTASQAIFVGFGTTLVYLAGRTVRLLRHRVSLEAGRADLALREQEVLAREAVVAERERIARELHDVIAHDVSVMVIHAAAAHRLVSDESGTVTEALAQIQETGRKAIQELYLLLGMLRDGSSDVHPQPGLGSVEDLVADVRRSGVPVELSVTGGVRPLDDALDLSAYRVVQEALTNVIKHAGASTTSVRLEYTHDELTVRVIDDGDGVSSADDDTVPSGGHGLLGMRERVRMFGGVLTAGARPEGGWSVIATLPMVTGPT